MRYAVIALTGDIRGYTIKWSFLAWRHRAFAGSYAECQAWIAGYKRALSDQEIEQSGKVTLSVVPWEEAKEAS
jgi:hypothetical protein